MLGYGGETDREKILFSYEIDGSFLTPKSPFIDWKAFEIMLSVERRHQPTGITGIFRVEKSQEEDKTKNPRNSVRKNPPFDIILIERGD